MLMEDVSIRPPKGSRNTLWILVPPPSDFQNESQYDVYVGTNV